MSFLQFISYLGIFVFSITGALKARAFKLDIFGGLVLAFVTAFGGGTLRDLLIGVKPVNWMNDNIALCLVAAGAGITFLIKDHFNKFRRTIFFTDAIGIGLFTAVGIERAGQFAVNDLYSIIMGVTTATFGGLIADILCNQVPNLLKRGELYATACAAGGIVYVLLQNINLNNEWCLFLCVLVVVGLRIYSKRTRLMLPDI